MNYENLSDDLKINVMSYLDYETNIALSQTNKNNNILYDKIKKNNYIPLYSTKKCYIHKRNRNLNNLFYTLLFVKILSYNEKYIIYKHIKYGNYHNYKYPINSYLLYFLSHDIIQPSYGHKVVVTKSTFDNEKYFFINLYFNHYVCIYFYIYRLFF